MDLYLNFINVLRNFVKWLIDAGTWLFTPNSAMGNSAPAYWILGIGLLAVVGVGVIKALLPI